MKRGDVVLMVAQGDHGKPRPAVVVQSDRFNELATVVVCPFTSEMVDSPTFRLTVVQDSANGLHVPSQIMADKIIGLSHPRIRESIDSLGDETMLALNRMLVLLLGLSNA